MSVTFGFYNSKEGDRRYDAIQMSSIFDGIIQDGILQHVGTAMVVKESEAMIINVGVGRAWFNHTWTLNDALLPLVVPQSDMMQLCLKWIRERPSEQMTSKSLKEPQHRIQRNLRW